MPQMAPINWMSLFILFLLTYIMFNIMNYFIYSPKIKKIKSHYFKKTNFYNWKW